MTGFNSNRKQISSLYLYEESLALRVPQLEKVIVEADFGELILQMNPEIHVFHRMDDDVDELHAGDHEVDVEDVVVLEVMQQGFEST